VLDKIVRAKHKEIERDFAGVTARQLFDGINGLSPARDFQAALRQPGLSLIAEIKPASPSRGIIASDVDPAVFAAAYETAGADAVSVLTDDEFFGGDLNSLAAVRAACSLPVLRKDFILDERQVYQSRLAGADAILLIAAILDDAALDCLISAAAEAGLHVLAEAHNESEIRRLMSRGCEIIGINNRNLADFSIDLSVTEELAKLSNGAVLVSESGIKNSIDAARAAKAGADAVLVGEALMTAGDIKATIADIKGVNN
jgi:indole-3-glycerol phosphate synthase